MTRYKFNIELALILLSLSKCTIHFYVSEYLEMKSKEGKTILIMCLQKVLLVLINAHLTSNKKITCGACDSDFRISMEVRIFQTIHLLLLR